MKKLKHLSFIVLLFAVFFISSLSAHAELFNRGTDILGNRLIYDSDLNITWYDYTKANDYWHIQREWAFDLSVDFSGVTYDDWRLPITFSHCEGYNCTDGEMGHLYYLELNGQISDPFQKLLPEWYFFLTEDNLFFEPYDFSFNTGAQGVGSSQFNYGYAIAVRSGDVAVVPEPISSILFIAGGTLLAGRRYMKRKNRA